MHPSGHLQQVKCQCLIRRIIEPERSVWRDNFAFYSRSHLVAGGTERHRCLNMNRYHQGETFRKIADGICSAASGNEPRRLAADTSWEEHMYAADNSSGLPFANLAWSIFHSSDRVGICPHYRLASPPHTCPVRMNTINRKSYWC